MYWADKILNANHALIAGCSGSGKSVALNTVIYRALTNGKLSLFVLIDLKRVELSDYRYLPQTLTYADTIADAKQALRGVLNLIGMRYEDMQRQGLKRSSEPPVYVLIDEYADLVLLDKSVNPLVQRISQIGRASEVHLILCTQRPTSSDGVLTGAIKCNLETRLALRTMTAQDSRNIIGVKGAESLPRYGYGILQDCGYNETVKIEMTDRNEIMNAVNHYGGAKWDSGKDVSNTKKRKQRKSIFGFRKSCTQMS